MVDRVYPLKLETPEDGSQTNFYPNELNPNEDAVSVRGVYLQNDASDDLTAFLSRDGSNNMTFQDGGNVTPVTLSDLTFPTPTGVGQFLYSADGTAFDIVQPIISDVGFVLVNDSGAMIVETP